jgi:hypothetical protein
MIYKRILTLTALSILTAGCSIGRAPTPAADYFYLNPDRGLGDIARVVLVQLDNNSNYPQISTDITRALFEELQKKQRFSIRVVDADDSKWRSLQLDLDSDCKPQQLFNAARTLKCDAILVGTITEYVPYPHMTIGLRLKIISLDNGGLIWAFEQVWDTADKKTEYRIKKYLAKQTRTGSETLGEQLVTVSALRFVKFIAYEVAATL